MHKKILLGLTTTPGSDWHEKTKEIDHFGIREVALFPTFLEPDKRAELYALLEKTGLQSIPLIHLRDDYTEEEIRYFVKRYGTKLFNIHPSKEAQETFDLLTKMNLPVYIENPEKIAANFESIVAKSAGLCVDFSHYHDYSVLCHEDNYAPFENMMKKYPIGFCHVSAIKKTKHREFDGVFQYVSHHFDDLEDLDYMKDYKDFLPEFISLELENSFEEQLEAKAYLEKILELEKE